MDSDHSDKTILTSRITLILIMIAAIALLATLWYLGVYLNILICAAMFFLMMLVMLNVGGIGSTLGHSPRK